MKIAIVSDETGEKLDPHFGRADKYVVVTVAEGQEVDRELREKPTHHHGQHQHDEHGHEAETDSHEERHARMLQAISDCDTLIAGGIGIPMQQAALARGMEVTLTREKDIDEIVRKYLDGILIHEPKLAHRPGHH